VSPDSHRNDVFTAPDAMTRRSLPPVATLVLAGALSVPACVQSPSPQSTGATGEGPKVEAPEPDRSPAGARATLPSPRVVSPILRLDAAPGAAEAERAAASLREARRAADAGGLAAALATFDRVAETVPAFEDWAQMLAADAAAAAGDVAEARRRLSLAEPARVREWGWMIEDRAYRAAGDTAGALTALEEAASKITDASRRAEALRRVGEGRARAGDAAGAVAAYRSAMEAAPQSRGARDAAAALPRLPHGPAERLAEGRVWLRHGNVDRGSAAIQSFLGSGAGTPAMLAETRLVLGRALFNARRYSEAERHLLAAAGERAAAPAVAAEATLLAGRAQFRDGRRDAARATLASVADLFPGEPFAAQALFILGDLDQDAGRLGAARSNFQRAASLGVDAPDAALSAVRLASILMLDGQPRAAAEALDRFAEGRADDRLTAQTRYWAARAHHAAGDRATAEQRFAQARAAEPVSYYGKLAAGRLGGSLEDIQLAADPVVDPGTSTAVGIALFRVDLLREIGREDLSAFEMERARADLEGRSGALYLIAEAHLARGAPVAGMLLGREIQRREGEWNARLLRIVFPFPHRELVEREARRNGLDPFMVAGLIRQESMFNPIAVSPAGAVGLMQIMPATGQMLARRAGVSGFQPSMLRQPELNVRLGTLFLADLLARNGTPTEAFAAYNAGPGRLAQWRSFPEIRDEEMFAERIPFAETRDYVKILSFNTRLYRMLYGS
jgi:soluble lytic murein transglycosylase